MTVDLLPDYLRCSELNLETFKRHLKRHFCLHTTSAFSALEVFLVDDSVLYKFTFYYLLLLLLTEYMRVMGPAASKC